MKLTGVLKTFDHGKGFGFIKRDDGQGDVFLHAQELRSGAVEPTQMQNRATRFEFDVVSRDKGQRAVNVRVVA